MYVHSSRILKQIEVLTSRGIPVEPVYDLAQITPQEVTDPGKMFSFEQFHSVLEYAIEQTGDEYYGLRLGQEPYLAGTIGMMCASCRNLKEAFIQGCKYFEVQGNFAEIRFIKDTQYPKIEYTLTNAWRLKYPETARHEVDAVFSYLVQVLTINSNNTIKPYQVLLTREVPEDNHDYKKIFGIIPQFEQEKNVIVFREKDLLIPMKAFNPDSFQLLKNHI